MDSMKEEIDDLSEHVATILESYSGSLIKCTEFYKVSPEQCHEMVKQVEDWYDKQAHLPEGYLDKRSVIRHLITKSFSVERVKEKLEYYYSAKNKMPELLKNRDPMSPNLDRCLRDGFWVVFPKRTPENHRVTMFRIKQPGPFSVVDVIKLAFMIADYRIRNDSAVGDHWILDCKNMAFQHAVQLNPVIISKIAFYLNNCVTPKLKGMHIINMPAYVETALALFKRTMKNKLLKRIRLYSSLEEVMKQFSVKIVPIDFGGEEICCDDISESWRKALQSPAWRQWFIDQDNACTDESKRLTHSSDELFGSFKKLDID